MSKTIQKTCPTCGEVFTTRNQRAKYCSAQCRVADCRIRQQAKYQTNENGYRDRLLAYQKRTKERRNANRQRRMDLLRLRAACAKRVEGTLSSVRLYIVSAYANANPRATQEALLAALKVIDNLTNAAKQSREGQQ